MTVAIVTDSAAAVPPPLAAECGITVVPMWLVSDGEAVREGERTLGELLGDARITTSAPTPGEFEDAIRAALERGASDVLVLTIASAMSASHDAAAVAVRDVGQHGARRRHDDRGRCAGAGRVGGGPRRQRRPVARRRHERRNRRRGASPAGGDGARPRASGAERPGSRDRGLGRAHARAQPVVRVPHRQGAPAPSRAGSTPPTTGWSHASVGTPSPIVARTWSRSTPSLPRPRRRCSTESATPTRWSRSPASSAR